ncbi:MAG TPA: hypothetical protein VHD33_08260 [Legionellaceae bacterium]|nr:hypothetical protein [Legionellaceae bacterium]
MNIRKESEAEKMMEVMTETIYGLNQDTLAALDIALAQPNKSKEEREDKFINKVAIFVCASGPRPCPHHINQAKEILAMVKEIL